MDPSTTVERLRRLALEYPGASEGISCAGTALETPTVIARQKAFMFVGHDSVRIKISKSLPDATKLARRRPDQVRVGIHGWTIISFATGNPLAEGVIEDWIEESYRLLAPKRLVASLNARAAF